MFQCRTRLCWWCKEDKDTALRIVYNVSMPHAALLVVQDAYCWDKIHIDSSFNAARGFVGGARTNGCEDSAIKRSFQCRTRLCWWCKKKCNGCPIFIFCFNAARGFVGGARMILFLSKILFVVSMPHAALLVVQGSTQRYQLQPFCFNAARGFVGGAS